MIAIVDYGVGNLRSVQKAFESVGFAAVITSDPALVASATGVVLPGVGAFGDAMVNLRRLELLAPLRAYAKGGGPLLGICLGMQLLFSVSEEHGEHIGLGFIPGRVKRMRGDFKIPHVGWNQLSPLLDHPLLAGVERGAYAYFVHSFYVAPVDASVIAASTSYHQEIPAVVADGHIFGMQFHPEKSSQTGLTMLRNFAAYCTTASKEENAHAGSASD
ncbi:MAG: imidazole glycerol phosphate synthase subunit HisH [Bacilli bacterium]